MAHVVFLINRLPSKALKGKITFELLHGKPPDLSFLRSFGCQCFASTLITNRKKFDPRARKGIYLGHRAGIKGFLVYDLQSRDIIVSRNVTFHENVFPLNTNTDATRVNPNSDHYVTPSLLPAPDSYDMGYESVPNTFHHSDPSPPTSSSPTLLPSLPANTHTAPHNITDPHPTTSDNAIVPRKSQRTRKPPSYLKDFHCTLASSSLAEHSTLVMLY